MNTELLQAKTKHVLSRMRRVCFKTRFDKIQSVPGWTQESQLRGLMKMVKSLPEASSIVELGVWQGRSALAMAEACRGTSKRVFAIDPWEDYRQAGITVGSRLNEWGTNSFEENYAAFLMYREELGLECWISCHRSTSLAAAGTWSDGPVAMLFVDGNHDYEAVSADLAAWFPLVRSGGLIVGDDWCWDTVRDAVTDFLKSHQGCRLELPFENTWVFTKQDD